jgi:hypothetical protein
MGEWWEGQAGERYWCEITNRDDIGADLKCPQADENGDPYWGYSLIHAISPGDIVYHYSIQRSQIVGASVAGGPVEPRPIVWASRTAVKKRPSSSTARPGWWRPLYSFTRSASPISLATLNEPDNQEWIRRWAASKGITGATRLPVQLYPGRLRGAQGYLTKMPADFVSRWKELSALENQLSKTHEVLAASTEVLPQSPESANFVPVFRPKSAEEYLAVISASVQRRSRKHEALVAAAGRLLQGLGMVVSTPHPLDLLVTAPRRIIFEAKVTEALGPLIAIRHAIGQLYEYRRFRGPSDAALCVLLDVDPGDVLLQYVEDELHLNILWVTDGALNAGPRTSAAFLSPWQSQERHD